MSRATHIRAADYRVMPWRNGRGETVEIARSPTGGEGLDGFDWRMSVAPVVADGAFSAFPGIERTIVVIEGAGMELALGDGRIHRLLPGEPFTYDGGMAVHGRLLDGPVRDLNLMVRRAACRGTLIVAGGRLALSGSNDVIVAHALAGDWICGGERIAGGNSLLLEDPRGLLLEPQAAESRLALGMIGRR
jgi:hypothetical protein